MRYDRSEIFHDFRNVYWHGPKLSARREEPLHIGQPAGAMLGRYEGLSASCRDWLHLSQKGPMLPSMAGTFNPLLTAQDLTRPDQ